MKLPSCTIALQENFQFGGVAHVTGNTRVVLSSSLRTRGEAKSDPVEGKKIYESIMRVG